jgi:hypothetical protein
LANYTNFSKTNTSTSNDDRLEFAAFYLVSRRCGLGNLFHGPEQIILPSDGNANASAIKTHISNRSAALSGIMFAAGLYNSGMIYASKVFDSWMFPPFHLVGDPTRLCHGGLYYQLDSYQFVNVDGITCDNVNTNNSANISSGKDFSPSITRFPTGPSSKGSKFGLLTSTTIDF